MKKFILFTLYLAFATIVNAQNDSAQIGKAFLEAVKTNDFKAVQKLIAPAAVYRKIAGKEVEGKTDKEIEDKAKNNPKLKSDFEAIQKAAKERKIDLSKLKFESVKVENPWGTETGPFAVIINITYEGKTDGLAISCMKDGDNWYLTEILTSSNAFRKLVE